MVVDTCRCDYRYYPPYLAESPCLARVRHKMECLPIGIEPVCPAPAAVEEVRKRYPGKKIIFSIGRLVAYKGYKYLIESAHYLDDDYVILIGGSGAMKYDLEAEIETWGVQDKVMLLGRISDKELSAYYGACTLFCLSSVQKTEAFGIVQIEAMSCGKPVVATNIPHSGVSWVNAHGFSGLNVTPCSAKELAGAIMTITRNDDLYQKLAKGARERYQETFTKEKMIDNILEIYRSLWKKVEVVSKAVKGSATERSRSGDIMSPIARTTKRFLDVVASIVGLAVFSPVLLVIYIAIKCEDHGKRHFQPGTCGVSW